MKHKTKPLSGTVGGGHQPKSATPARSPYAGKPLDGSQYLDVIEEQEYAERRPTADEQKPLFSYLKKPGQPADGK
jgi:hypothetical protein